MSLIARQDRAAMLLEKIREQLNHPVVFTRESTAFDMGVQNERERLKNALRLWEGTGRTE